MLPLATYTKPIPCKNTILRNESSCSSSPANGATYTTILLAVVFVNDRVVERLKATTADVTIIEGFVDGRGNGLF